MRLHLSLFLTFIGTGVLMTLWYITRDSFDKMQWSTGPSLTSVRPTPHPDAAEKQIDRLLDIIHTKDEELAQKNIEIEHKDIQYKELENQQQAKIKEIESLRIEAVKKAAKEKAAVLNKITEEEYKKKKEEAKKRKERNKLNDAFWVIREKMSQQEASLLRPIDIQSEERPNYTDKNNKLIPNGKSVLVLSAFDYQKHDNLTENIMNNRDEYCNYHGYTHYFINTTRYQKDDEYKRSPAWWKLPAIKDAFNNNPEAEWIWWLDYDIIITNEEVDLAQHLLSPYVLKQRIIYGSPVNSLGNKFSGLRMQDRDFVDIDKIDIILSQDYSGINAGSFFIRRSAFSNFLLDIWEDPLFITKHWLREEQDAFIYLYENHKTVYEHTAIVPQRAMNAYSKCKIKAGEWRKGDLAIHLTSGPSAKRDQSFLDTFARYWRLRKRVPEKYQIN